MSRPRLGRVEHFDIVPIGTVLVLTGATTMMLAVPSLRARIVAPPVTTLTVPSPPLPVERRPIVTPKVGLTSCQFCAGYRACGECALLRSRNGVGSRTSN